MNISFASYFDKEHFEDEGSIAKLSLADLIGALLLFSILVLLCIPVLFLESYLAKNDAKKLSRNIFPMTEVKHSPQKSLAKPETVAKWKVGMHRM